MPDAISLLYVEGFVVQADAGRHLTCLVEFPGERAVGVASAGLESQLMNATVYVVAA
jgi:hypothetical protein